MQKSGPASLLTLTNKGFWKGSTCFSGSRSGNSMGLATYIKAGVKMCGHVFLASGATTFEARSEHAIAKKAEESEQTL